MKLIAKARADDRRKFNELSTVKLLRARVFALQQGRNLICASLKLTFFAIASDKLLLILLIYLRVKFRLLANRP